MGTIVAGFDPGSKIFGFCFLDVGVRDFSIVEIGHISLHALEQPARLVVIRRELHELILKHGPKRIGIERGFVQFDNEKRQQSSETVLTLAEARGVATEVAAASGAHVERGTVQQIRKYVCIGGKGGRADKIDVAIAICSTLGLKTCPQGDEADAAACAIYTGWMERNALPVDPFAMEARNR